MNDPYMEAQASIRSDEHNGDRERAYEKEEAQAEAKDVADSIMGLLSKIDEEAAELKNLLEDESYKQYFWDEKHAL